MIGGGEGVLTDSRVVIARFEGPQGGCGVPQRNKDVELLDQEVSVRLETSDVLERVRIVKNPNRP